MTLTRLNLPAIIKGLELPQAGKPEQRIYAGNPVSRMALLGRDYPGIKPTLLVQPGDTVKLGQPLFVDRKNPRIAFTSPACGRVAAINRGERRVFVSLTIEADGNEEMLFPTLEPADIPLLTGAELETRLLESGLWSGLRTRPFSRIPLPGSRPDAIFVTALDTNPLAADPAVIIAEKTGFFQAGLQALTRLTDGKVYLCQAGNVDLPAADGVVTASFSGPHPAGLPGTHIHVLYPVDMQRIVWHLGYQEVIAIGTLLLTGRIMTERIVSLAGPGVKQPRLLRTLLGADLEELTAGNLLPGDNRLISGSVLSGHQASGDTAFLGRYHNQVSVLAEERQRRFLDWLMPGRDKHSVKRLFAGSLFPPRDLPLTTSVHGSPRAMVPVGAYEKVMPLDLQITWLLRSLLANDPDMARNLGCLELDEEDLALCSYVCPGKIDYGAQLRQILNRIEEEEG